MKRSYIHNHFDGTDSLHSAPVQTPEPAATDIPQVNMPNPASVYCEQNGTNSKFTLLPMAAKTEYVFFRMAAPVTSGPISGESVAWQHKKARHLPWLLRQPQIASGGGPGGSNQLRRKCLGRLHATRYPEEIADWWGVIKSTEPGAQYDDYFERQDLGQIIYFGIDSMDPAVKSQIEALRDSGKIVHLYGTLFSNVPDYNGSQVQVDRIEVEE